MNDAEEKMSCAALRQSVLADPAARPPGFTPHVDTCPACAAFLRTNVMLDAEILAAGAVPPPPSFEARLIARHHARTSQASRGEFLQRLRRRFNLPAFAAACAGAVLLAFATLTWLDVRESTSLARDVLAMVQADGTQMPVERVDAEAHAARLLAHAGVRLASGVTQARFQGPCDVRGTKGALIRLATVHGEASLILLPALRVSRQGSSSAGGLSALVVPHGGGAAVVVVPSSRSAQDVARLLM